VIDFFSVFVNDFKDMVIQPLHQILFKIRSLGLGKAGTGGQLTPRIWS